LVLILLFRGDLDRDIAADRVGIGAGPLGFSLRFVDAGEVDFQLSTSRAKPFPSDVVPRPSRPPTVVAVMVVGIFMMIFLMLRV
jgi:hypothetical protein